MMLETVFLFLIFIIGDNTCLLLLIIILMVIMTMMIIIIMMIIAEMQKFFGSFFFQWDEEMRCKETGEFAICNSSDLNEELGQVGINFVYCFSFSFIYIYFYYQSNIFIYFWDIYSIDLISIIFILYLSFSQIQ